jgi:hypothetical protein
MYLPSRRRFIRVGLQGGAFALASSWFPFHALGSAATRRAEAPDPHFFLFITEGSNTGLDSSYWFDARPLKMTEQGLIQNYRNSGEPKPWTGLNGVTTLATEIVAPLKPYRDYFSVINGVYMSPDFDGHDQNWNFMLTGNPFGGNSFVPELNVPGPGSFPLDAVQQGTTYATTGNTSKVVSLKPSSIQNLLKQMGGKNPIEPASPLAQYIRGRTTEVARGPGALSAAAQQLLGGFSAAPNLADILLKTRVTGHDDSVGFIQMIGELFKAGATRCAVLSLSPPGNLDVHDAASAAQVPANYASVSQSLAGIFEALRTQAYDGTRSLLDVTTVMFSTEFGRTLRQLNKNIAQTGTDHNTFNNFILIGGKGIKGGQVIGASDFMDGGESLSGAHLAKDPNKLKAMGKPFDFAHGTSRADLPQAFNIADYLSYASIVNTVLTMFQAPREEFWLLEKNGPVAPTLTTLV